jgi:hypothetical protein
MIKSLKFSQVIFILAIITAIIYGNSSFKKDSLINNKYLKEVKTFQKISDIILEKKLSYKFDKINLFVSNNKNSYYPGLNNFVSNSSLLKIRKDVLQDLISKNLQNITLVIPLVNNTNLELELTRQNFFSGNFKVNAITQNGKIPINYTPGLYYNGIINGNKNSIASVSIFNNEVIGILSDENGNYNLGSILDVGKLTDNYIYYSENDMFVRNKFRCSVDDNIKKFTKPLLTSHNSNLNDARLPVNVSIVTDYQTYLDKNSDTNSVVNFITGLFNSVYTIYQNEFLPINLSEISYYTFPDPYRSLNDPISILLAFGANTQTFNGNLAHLLSTRNGNFGGISWIRTLGSHFNSSDSSGPYSFSNIDTNYINYPTYSWTVTVVSHEMGHSFGSQHTHACVWPVYNNGGIGAIDSCYASAENIGICFLQSGLHEGPYVPTFGTIMSYCHLTAPYGGIDLSLGFGPMPGDTIRLRYNQDSEFGPVINSSEQPTKFLLLQNYPNPFNPSTNISFAIPEDALVTLKVYDINGREIATLASNIHYARGLYNVFFNSQKYSLSSGIYFYKIFAYSTTKANEIIYSGVKKMILIK